LPKLVQSGNLSLKSGHRVDVGLGESDGKVVSVNRPFDPSVN
jgi:hypothetical protein